MAISQDKIVTNMDGRVDESQNDRPDHEKQALELVYKAKDEARNYRQSGKDGSMSLEEEWRDCGNRYMGNYDAPSGSVGLQEGYRVMYSKPETMGKAYRGLHRARLMRTQNAIISNVSEMNQRPPHPHLLPAQTGFTDGWFLTKVGAVKVRRFLSNADAQLDVRKQALVDQAEAAHREATQKVQGVYDAAQLEQIRDQQVAQIEQQIEQQKQQVRGQIGDPQEDQLDGPYGPARMLDRDQYERMTAHPELGLMLGDDDLVAMNDSFVTKGTQRVLDNRWDLADVDLYILMGSLYKSIYGQQDYRFMWNPRTHEIEIDTSHILNVYTDHRHYDMKRREHHLETYVLSEKEAIRRWPEANEPLRRASGSGMQDDGQYTKGGIFGNAEFERDMVTVTIGWFRNETVPMTKHEALEQGKIIEVPMRDVIQPEGQSEPPETPPDSDELPGTVSSDHDPDDDEQTVYVLADDKTTIVEPQSDVNHGTQWPNTTGIRQVSVIDQANVVIEDIRCPYLDIPHAWDLNLPRADMSPYGQGEPVRVRDIDDQINRVLSILANYMAYFQFPQYFWPHKLLAKVRRLGFSLHSRPGANIPIPEDEYWKIIQAGGFSRIRHDTPPVPPVFMEYLQFLLNEHDTSSGNVDVSQGRAPFKGASGRAIENLSAQARGTLQLRSRFTEIAVTRLAYLSIDAIVKWLPDSEWLKILNEYEWPVVEELIRRARVTEWNMRVQTVTGRGTATESKQAQALELHRRGAMSTQTLMDEFDIEDPSAELERIREEQAPPAESEVAQQVDASEAMQAQQSAGPAQVPADATGQAGRTV